MNLDHMKPCSEDFSWQGGTTIDAITGRLTEATIGEINFKYVWWLELALEAARHVARIHMPFETATGFLVNQDIFMTNNHVFEDKQDAASSTLQFNYRETADGSPAAVDAWQCDPDDLFHTNPALDYSIVRVKPKGGKKAGEVWGHFDLRHGQDSQVGQRVNIIQHASGRFQEIAFRDNQLKFIDDTILQYVTDTQKGSSGSPVLDDWFNVIGLHNQRVPDPNSPSTWYRNQGYRVEAILADAGNRIP